MTTTTRAAHEAHGDQLATAVFPPVLAQGFRHAAADLGGEVLPRIATTRDSGDVSALTQAIQRLIVETPHPLRQDRPVTDVEGSRNA